MDEPQSQGQSPPENGQEENNNGRPSFWRRPPVVIAGTIALAGLLFIGLGHLADSLTHESTDNAFLESDMVSIAPRVFGQVKKVYVADNQPVTNWQPLLDIDPSDYDVVLAQKKAAQAAAEANVKLLQSAITLLGAQVATAEATAKKSEAEAAADQATADKAAADLKRAEDLFQRKIISPQEYDSAKAAAASASATLKAGQEETASDRAKIAEAQAQLGAGRQAWERARAQADQSQVDVQQAELNLSYTHIAAPEDGHITRKAVDDGDYVQVGQKLMALVRNDLWVTANFKETQLKKIRVGQPVEVSIDSVAGKKFPARVESIQSGSGAAFSLLPPENAVGNYVKVVQRIPVKIVFTGPVATDHVLGPGMSVSPSVQVRNYVIPVFVVAIVAMALALAAGLFWWRFAKRTETNEARPTGAGGN